MSTESESDREHRESHQSELSEDENISCGSKRHHHEIFATAGAIREMQIGNISPTSSTGGPVGSSTTTTNSRLAERRGGDRHIFRLRGKRFLLTYPQTSWEEGVPAAVALCQRLGAVRYLVCRESHADGSQHVHVYLEVPIGISTGSPSFFDLELLGGSKHGNYQVVRSARGAAAYVLKDDHFESFGFSGPDLAALKRHNRGKASQAILERGLSGERIETIALDYPELVVQRDMQKIQNQIDRVRNFNNPLSKRILTSVPLFNYTYSFDPTKACRGPGGNLHPWIWGAAGTGKSSLYRNSGFRFYSVDDVCNWVGYDDADYDAIVFDEITPTNLKKIGFALLNKLLDGFPVRMNTKGSHIYVQKKMPIFFISNYEIQTLEIPGDASFSPFISRLILLECRRAPPGSPSYSVISENINNHFI